MHNIINRFLLINLALLTALASQAAVSFTVHAPSQVTQGNKFTVTYVLRNAEGSNLDIPDIDGAQKIYGPALSTSYSSSWVNGKSSSSTSQEYQMIYKAIKPGRYHVGAASITADGKRYSTQPFTIQVVDNPNGNSSSNGPSAYSQQPQQQGGGVRYNDPTTQSADKAVTGRDVMVRIEMSSPRVYEQQAVVCTIKLYTKYQVTQFMPTLQPSFDGFLIEEIPMQPSLNNVETLNGQEYMVAILKKCILYPQKAGTLTITSGNYDVNVVQYENYRSLFGTLSQPVERKIQVKSNSASVNILPLPEPQPASFTGAVGRFNVRTDLVPQQLKSYAAATYSYIIQGTGNIKYIKAPEVKFPEQFDVYDPKTTVTANPNGDNTSGTVKIDYTFIPQYAGSFDLPESEFTYFDPETGKYESITLPARHLEVAKGQGSPSNHYRLKNMDIRGAQAGSTASQLAQGFMVDKAGYWAGYILPLLALVGLLIYNRKRLRERADLTRMRARGASKVAQKRLKAARAAQSRGNRTAFYNEMLSALWGYLSDKLNIPGSELSRDNVQAHLAEHGVDDSLQQATIALIDECEFAQYAPELANNDLGATLDRASQLIDNLEKVKLNK